MRLRSSSRPTSGGSSIIRRERSASDIDLAVHINDAAYRAAMNSPPDPKLRTSFQCPTNLESTAWELPACCENQGHAVTGGDPGTLAGGFGRPKYVRPAHDVIQLLKQLTLLVDQQFRVTDDVDE